MIPRAAAGLICGVAAWASLGRLAIIAEAGQLSSVGLLPPLWSLALFSVLGAWLAHYASGVSTALFLLPAVTVLPWLGLTQPALLIWTGAFVALPWAALLVGIARAGFAKEPGAFRIAVDRGWVVFAVSVAMVGSFAAWTRLPLSGDEPHYLLMTSSLLQDGDVELANDYDLQRHQQFYPGSLEPRHVTLTPAGRQYPIHGLGTSVLVAPGFALAGVTGARMTIVLLSALGVAFLWHTVRSMTGSLSAAWVAASALVLQVPFAAHARSIYPDAPAAVVTCCSLWLLRRIEAREAVSLAGYGVLGLMLSTLPWLHIRLSAVAAAFAIAILLLAARRRVDLNQLAWFLAAPLVSAALWMASAYVMFETANPGALLHHAGSFSSLPLGLLGSLADQEFGLLPFAPGLVFGAVGLWNRSLPATSLAAVAAVVGTLAAVSSHDWWGGTSAPARFLIPVLPALAWGVGYWWSRAIPVMRCVCLMTVVISGTLLLIGAHAGDGRYLVNVPDGRQSLFASLSHSVDAAALLPSLFSSGDNGLREGLTAGVWTLTAVAVIVGLLAVGDSGGRNWSLAAGGVVLWISLASSVVPMLRQRPVATDDRSQFALLAASVDTWLTTGVARLQKVDRQGVLRLLAFRPATEETLGMVARSHYPAGRYRFELMDHQSETSSIAVSVGRSAEPVWLLGPRDGATDSFTLGAPVRNLRITASDEISVRDVSIRLRPLEIGLTGRGIDAAQHVRRYGSLIVYSSDPLTSLAPEGFWLWSGRRTSFVTTSAGGLVPSVRFSFRAIGRAVNIRFARGDWQCERKLDIDATEDCLAPSSDTVTPVVVDVDGERAPDAVWVMVSPR
jgi:hypothetical protein